METENKEQRKRISYSTRIAILAFSQAEKYEYKAEKARRDSDKAILLVPETDMDEYMSRTENIRQMYDSMSAKLTEKEEKITV